MESIRKNDHKKFNRWFQGPVPIVINDIRGFLPRKLTDRGTVGGVSWRRWLPLRFIGIAGSEYTDPARGREAYRMFPANAKHGRLLLQ